MVNRIGGSNKKGFNSRFWLDSWVRHESHKESRKTYRPKSCEYNNKDDFNSLNILSDYIHTQTHTHTRAHTFIYIYIYIYRERERERERERKKERKKERKRERSQWVLNTKNSLMSPLTVDMMVNFRHVIIQSAHDTIHIVIHYSQ